MTIDAYLSHLCQHCGLEEDHVTISVEEEDEYITVQLDVPSDDVGLLIGHRGENIASLQRMLRVVFRDQYPEKQIRLNINDYREERVSQLQEKAKNIAARVQETGESYRFPYLSSYERYVVHAAISEDENFSDIESVSEGEGSARRLVIQKKD